MENNYCTNCGSKIDQTTNYCPNCGESFDKTDRKKYRDVSKKRKIKGIDVLLIFSIIFLAFILIRIYLDNKKHNEMFSVHTSTISDEKQYENQVKTQTNNLNNEARSQSKREIENYITNDDNANNSSIKNDINLLNKLDGEYKGSIQSVNINGGIMFTTFMILINNNYISWKMINDDDVTVLTGTFTFSKHSSINDGELEAVFTDGDTQKFNYYQNDNKEYDLKIIDFLVLSTYERWIEIDVELKKIDY